MKNNKLKLLGVNITIFIAIFSLFSLFIYNTVAVNQYKGIDKELSLIRTALSENNIEGIRSKEIRNSRIVAIIKDLEGNVINVDTINQFYIHNSENFKIDVLDEITNMEIEQNHFRTLAFKSVLAGKGVIIQLVVNINSINDIMKNLLNILIFGGMAIILICIGASWYLANKSMAPIIRSWQKQVEFATNASHELRTPLTIVRTRLELLLKEPNARIIDKYDDIEPALSEVNRLTKMVGSLLTLARADSNLIEIERKNHNLKVILEPIIEPYIEFCDFQNKKIVVNIEPVILNCDGDRIKQLLIILLDNAIKYTEEGQEILVKISCKKQVCTIEISDTGCGIDDKNKEKIFDRFFRGDMARRVDNNGVGLGLSIAKWIVEAHGGNIYVYDNTPKGTRFIANIPQRYINK